MTNTVKIIPEGVEKLKQLESDLNNSKKITIKNGFNLVIEHNCPNRGHFFDTLEKVGRADGQEGISYEFIQESSGLGFRVSPIVAKYIFLKEFSQNINGSIVKIRQHNRAVVYNNARNKILKANSVEELKSITWNFIKPNGVEISIDEKVKEIKEGDNLDLKKALEKALDKDGNLHFIKKLDDLEQK